MTHFSLDVLPLLKQYVNTGEPLIVSDTRRHPEWIRFPDAMWIVSYLSIPIQIHGGLAGLLSLDSATPFFFNSSHAERLKIFANQAAIAIENARLYEEVRKLAVTDPLTGIFDRGYFESELARMELSQDFPVSVIVADLDNMKKINDAFGRPAGDELLRCAAQVLCATFRATDILSRIGGDEFAILLPRTDAVRADEILAGVRSKLEEHNAKHSDLPIHLSLGTSTAENGNLEEAFIAADRQIYKDKSARKPKNQAAGDAAGLP